MLELPAQQNEAESVVVVAIRSKPAGWFIFENAQRLWFEVKAPSNNRSLPEILKIIVGKLNQRGYLRDSKILVDGQC